MGSEVLPAAPSWAIRLWAKSRVCGGRIIFVPLLCKMGVALGRESLLMMLSIGGSLDRASAGERCIGFYWRSACPGSPYRRHNNPGSWFGSPMSQPPHSFIISLREPGITSRSRRRVVKPLAYAEESGHNCFSAQGLIIFRAFHLWRARPLSCGSTTPPRWI